MTREEMIRKVMECVANKSCFNDDKGWVCCVFCQDYENEYDGVQAIKHTEDCPVLLARQFLSEPVIEVGDVMTINDLPDKAEYVVKSTGLILLKGDFEPWKESDLTLIRKGGNDN